MKNIHSSILICIRQLSLLTCCCFFLAHGNSQSITFAFVNAAGFDEGPDCSLRWTIGEPMTVEVSGESGTLRMGFLPFAFTEELASATAMPLNIEIEIGLSPNPATDQIQVKVPGDQRYLLRILSVDGRPVLATDITEVKQIDIHDIPAGTYLLYILDPNGSYNSTTFIKS